jgi:hypothetical protein
MKRTPLSPSLPTVLLCCAAFFAVAAFSAQKKLAAQWEAWAARANVLPLGTWRAKTQ